MIRDMTSPCSFAIYKCMHSQTKHTLTTWNRTVILRLSGEDSRRISMSNHSHHVTHSARRRRGCCARTVSLRRISHDHSHDASRKNDLQVVAMLHVGHQERENEPDREPENNSQEQ